MDLELIVINKYALAFRVFLLLSAFFCAGLIIYYAPDTRPFSILFLAIIGLYALRKFIKKSYLANGTMTLNDKGIYNEKKEIILNVDSIKAIKVYRFGFQGELYPYKFTKVGMLTAKSGINKIEIVTMENITIEKMFLARDNNVFGELYEVLSTYRERGIRILYVEYNRFDI